MEDYGWIITDANDDTLIGISGPRGLKFSHEEIKKKGQYWMMYDCDGVRYCAGYLLGDELFAPLDDYGEGSLGCTDIKYRNPNTGKFEIL